MQTIKLAGQATLVKSRLFKQVVKEALIKKQVLIPLFDANGKHIADLTGTSAKIEKEGAGNVVWYLSAEIPFDVENHLVDEIEEETDTGDIEAILGI
jgi:uncharacterized protein (UPF0333 family)